MEIIDEIEVKHMQNKVIGKIQLCKKPVEKGSDCYIYSIRCDPMVIKFETDSGINTIIVVDSSNSISIE